MSAVLESVCALLLHPRRMPIPFLKFPWPWAPLSKYFLVFSFRTYYVLIFLCSLQWILALGILAIPTTKAFATRRWSFRHPAAALGAALLGARCT